MLMSQRFLIKKQIDSEKQILLSKFTLVKQGKVKSNFISAKCW